MSKAAWSYRLPTPHPIKPPAFPFQPAKPVGGQPRNWYASQMDNYEHIKGGIVPQKLPNDIALDRDRYLQTIRAEGLAGRPLWAMDHVQQMFFKNIPPTTEHIREVLIAATRWRENETFRDCWRLMERQGIIPDDKTLCAALEGAGILGERDLILQIWNRYCTEFAFLEEGELDPKPLRRPKFTLTRDDLYNMSWWQKKFDFDCNRDLGDMHRFNRTREIQLECAVALAAVGEKGLGKQLLSLLCSKLRDTPTPVGEPMVDHNAVHPHNSDIGLEKKQTRYRIPNVYLFTLRRQTRGIDWIPNHEWLMQSHQVGPNQPQRSRDQEHGDPRFYSNEQYVLYAFEKLISAGCGDGLEGIEELEKEAEENLPEGHREPLNYEDLVTAVLERAAQEGVPGEQVLRMMHSRCEKRQLRPTSAMYGAVFRAFAGDCPSLDAAEEDVKAWQGEREDTLKALRAAITEWHDQRYKTDLDTHSHALDALVRVRSGEGHSYFVKHILRKFTWGNRQIASLLREYRDIGNAGDTRKQALLCKRAYVWCQRYNVGMSEANKQYIEDDYDRIRVQVRTKQELLVWKFRNQHRQREELKPYLPSPITDRVTHTLPFSDHEDPEHIQKWVVPYTNAGRSFNWAYVRPHAPPQATHVKDLTDIERVQRLPQKQLFSPFARLQDWESHGHSGYKPELTHEKLHINRWLEEPNKAFPGA
eukprot:Hpha_TRINITY_DN30753_c0_g1::TRINITY_DN30753_c0_g1_i1::g.28280::m.28280